ncbi:DUF2529 domain-containing protein [Alkalihalophilus marmarensis]|jgi:hypothetical protein|uniref:DUF2529 domain-containing protein n=1 Tax=Alkalihalophilus marmarensis TaxID=521377 RepID=UPI002040D560|nr:DUF2529 domain-containing protein [Alkalihalophilus marmarensis]MCM3489730.1 DUF2529 domain-containing protein [Alkalihalophilus marmarensis]
MIPIFTTQLMGRVKAVREKEEEFEDAARLLAQALVGQGTIYVYGCRELRGVTAEAEYGTDRDERIKPLTQDNLSELTPADRVLLFAPFTNDGEACRMATKLHIQGVPFASVSNFHDEKDASFSLADLHIDFESDIGLVPDEEGNRSGYPTSIIGLYTYFCIMLTVKEIMSEY